MGDLIWTQFDLTQACRPDRIISRQADESRKQVKKSGSSVGKNKFIHVTCHSEDNFFLVLCHGDNAFIFV